MPDEGYTLRKTEIMARAAELFREKGYQSTSVNEIAAEMGFSKPALYYYFKNKTEILWQIYNMSMGRALEEARRESAGALPPAEKLRRMLMTHVRLLCEELVFWTVMFDEEHSLPADQQKVIKAHRREYAGIFEQVYAQGIKSGDFKDCPPGIAVSAILGTFNWLYKWYRPGGDVTWEDVFQQYYRLLTSGYLTADFR